MALVTLTGIGESVVANPVSPLVLRISECATLKELSVTTRNPGTTLSGRYDPTYSTASVRILAADFQSMLSAVANSGQVSITYVYRDTDYKVAEFSWLPAAGAAGTTSVVPQSGTILASDASMSDESESVSKTG